MGSFSGGLTRRSSANTFIDGTTFNDSINSETSQSLDVGRYNKGRIYMDITKNNSPTSLLVTIQDSDDDSTYRDITEGAWGNMVFTTSENHSFPVEAFGRHIKVKIAATGTDASNTFVVTVKGEFMA